MAGLSAKFLYHDPARNKIRFGARYLQEHSDLLMSLARGQKKTSRPISFSDTVDFPVIYWYPAGFAWSKQSLHLSDPEMK